jgi:tetratricopeptide (TPR) repeat protein
MVLLGAFNLCYAQLKTNTISQAQLLKIQQLPVQEISNYLSDLGWKASKNPKSQLKSYFNYNLSFKTDKWELKLQNQWAGTIYIYYKENYPNLVIYQTRESTFNGLKPTYLETVKENNIEISIIAKSGLAMEFRNYLNEKTSKKYSVLCYNIESIKNLLFNEKKKKEERPAVPTTPKQKDKKLSADQERQTNFYSNLGLGDNYYEKGAFDKAIAFYLRAKEFIDPNDEKLLKDLEIKIQNCHKNIDDLTFQSIKDRAEDLFSEKKYKESLTVYEKAIHLHPGDKSLKERIDCINEIIKYTSFGNRSQIYRDINPIGFSKFNDLNFRFLNLMMKSAKDNGFMSYTFHIKFDEKGNNLSSFNINSLSDDQLMFNLDDINVSAIPSSEVFISCINKSYPIPSKDLLNFDLRWGTSLVKALVRGNEVNFSGLINTIVQDTLEKFINQFSSKNGLYTFKEINKVLNGKSFQDIWLTSFKKTTKGPNILPGLTAYNSTDGEKGKGTLTAFLFSAAIAVGSKIYADRQFEKYKDPRNVGDKEKFYTNANTANKIFLISGGLSVSIYIYDITSYIFHAKNKKNKNNILRSELKNANIPVLETPLHP